MFFFGLAGADVLYILTGRREGSGAAPPADDAFRLAVEVVQEWQIAQGKFLPVDKFLGVVELLAEEAGSDPVRIRK